ncbi:DsbA family protein [Tsukamurella spumae]|uniref:DsbA family protein n=1 Tax=Tsukamurella spumae TaxID=44753 RepID=A0A846WWJ3_9ACTN|nr:DsbA family protein [Tsukamurella spumae]
MVNEEKQPVALWFDPVCPWAWGTSRWLTEVTKVRPIDLQLRIMSLSALNEGGDVPPEFAERLAAGWGPVRVSAAIARDLGPAKLADFYTAIGTLIHHQGKDVSVETIRAALADAGLPESYADDAASTELDDDIRASTQAAVDAVGTGTGTPVTEVNGRAFSGPVIDSYPTGEEAGEFFDGIELTSRFSHFYELRRGRDGEPNYSN